MAACVRSASVTDAPSDSPGSSRAPSPKASEVALSRSAYSSGCRLLLKYCSRSSE